MKRTHWVSDYFRFTRKESIAVLTLISLILAIYFLPFIAPKPVPGPAPADTAWIAAARSLQAGTDEDRQQSHKSYSTGYSGQRYGGQRYNDPERAEAAALFYFDPNTLDATGWKKLGLRDKTIHTILNYREHGGRFRTPEDLRRIYGLFPDEYERLAPFVQIGQHNTPAEINNSTESIISKPMAYRSEKRAPSIVDINTTDTAGLLPLPGIGSKLAARIISFRDKLGGFHSVDQVGETFGLPDSTFQKIKPYLRADADAVRKININTATAEEMKTHPYIRWAIANAIVAYRKEHGPFQSIEGIKNLMAITTDIYTKLTWYIRVN